MMDELGASEDTVEVKMPTQDAVDLIQIAGESILREIADKKID